MYRLFIDYVENTSGGEIPDSEKNNPFPWHEDEYIEVYFNCLLRDSPDKMFTHSVEVDESVFNAENAYLAVIRYSDGGTFGKTLGYWQVVGIFKTKEQAWAEIKHAKESSDRDNYRPWLGNFGSHLDDEIYCLSIEDE